MSHRHKLSQQEAAAKWRPFSASGQAGLGLLEPQGAQTQMLRDRLDQMCSLLGAKATQRHRVRRTTASGRVTVT